MRRVLLRVVDATDVTSRWVGHVLANSGARPTRIAPGSAAISSLGTRLPASRRPYASTVSATSAGVPSTGGSRGKTRVGRRESLVRNGVR
ncbi:hypothetical protein [Streptosporangium saharense]|uniref:hypothetical protein n=1 Tax=Streptosporangium saharense TaxID=1706840 RepID=UPI00331B20BD